MIRILCVLGVPRVLAGATAKCNGEVIRVCSPAQRRCEQVIPYLKGQASSGKSTILLRVCRTLYDKADVGVLSNNIEKKFGIGAFSEKFLFVAPEIKADLQMEQAEFQSMVSGEDMSICVKYQTAHTAEWKVPGIMAGERWTPSWISL